MTRGATTSAGCPSTLVDGLPYDTPILGYRTNTANTCACGRREARHRSTCAFNAGRLSRAVQDKTQSENITKVLYPNDDPIAGKDLRLKQQSSSSRRPAGHDPQLFQARAPAWRSSRRSWRSSSTTPTRSLAVAELMRLLMDEEGMAWEPAWEITTEDLRLHQPHPPSRGPGDLALRLLRRVLPRHLEIIDEINRRFLARCGRASRATTPAARACRSSTSAASAASAWPTSPSSAATRSTAWPQLHSDLLKRTVLRDFDELWPGKFNNKTNGITPRRAGAANSGLSGSSPRPSATAG